MVHPAQARDGKPGPFPRAFGDVMNLRIAETAAEPLAYAARKFGDLIDVKTFSFFHPNAS